jgi:hypothetical protein
MANLFSTLRKYYVNLAFGPGSGTIFKAPSGLDTLDKSKILSITLHGEVLEIGPNAFRGWTGLTTAHLPCVIPVGSAAFSDCAGLKTIHLPAANFVGDRAFYNCADLEMISLPVAVSVGESAFHTVELHRILHDAKNLSRYLQTDYSPPDGPSRASFPP